MDGGPRRLLVRMRQRCPHNGPFRSVRHAVRCRTCSLTHSNERAARILAGGAALASAIFCASAVAAEASQATRKETTGDTWGKRDGFPFEAARASPNSGIAAVGPAPESRPCGLAQDQRG